uniref:Uncharacterized protein n=1 Tax=Arundo donax TaxID=35708 RepID=A0A0A9HIC8_ARUDO
MLPLESLRLKCSLIDITSPSPDWRVPN